MTRRHRQIKVASSAAGAAGAAALTKDGSAAAAAAAAATSQEPPFLRTIYSSSVGAGEDVQDGIRLGHSLQDGSIADQQQQGRRGSSSSGGSGSGSASGRSASIKVIDDDSAADRDPDADEHDNRRVIKQGNGSSGGTSSSSLSAAGTTHLSPTRTTRTEETPAALIAATPRRRDHRTSSASPPPPPPPLLLSTPASSALASQSSPTAGATDHRRLSLRRRRSSVAAAAAAAGLDQQEFLTTTTGGSGSGNMASTAISLHGDGGGGTPFASASSSSISPPPSGPTASSSSFSAHHEHLTSGGGVRRSITPSSSRIHHITLHEEEEDEHGSDDEAQDAGAKIGADLQAASSSSSSPANARSWQQQRRRPRAATTATTRPPASSSSSSTLSSSLGKSHQLLPHQGPSRPGLAGTRRQTTIGGGAGAFSSPNLVAAAAGPSSARGGAGAGGGSVTKKKVAGNRPASRSISTTSHPFAAGGADATATLGLPTAAATASSVSTGVGGASGNPRTGLTRRTSTPVMRPRQHQQQLGGGDVDASSSSAADASPGGLGLSLGDGPKAGGSSAAGSRPSVFRSTTPTRYMPVATPATPPLSPSSPGLPSLRLPPPTMASANASSSRREDSGGAAAVLYPPQRAMTPSAGNLAELVEEPSSAAAAGGLLSGAWYLGKAATSFAAQALGVIPAPSGGPVEYEDDSEDWRRRRAWITLGKKRGSGSESDDSEKGSLEHEAERYLGAPPSSFAADDDERASTESYFSLRTDTSDTTGPYRGGTLPTPALNSVSLSSGKSHRQHNALRPSPPRIDLSNVRSLFFGSKASKSRPSPSVSSPQQKAWAHLGDPSTSSSVGGRPRSSSAVSIGGLELAPGQTVRFDIALRAVVTEVGWSLLALAVVFLLSFGLVAMLVTSLPIHSLRSLPTKVSDLQALSIEIRQYMAASDAGWWHVITTLLVTGLWKHSWSVPGAVVLNILVGSLMSPLAAVVLLTVITSFGSLGAYLISRPLAPLIGLVFPKPLALVRSALGSRAEGRWRRLLVMRAMGLVPWSGMNVACGVVGVSPVVFLLTTAAGSASWSYVTASVGDIISQVGKGGGGGIATDGSATLTSLIRDPVMIFKMVVLSLLSLVPVLFKSRSSGSGASSGDDDDELVGLEGAAPHDATSSIISPTTRSMTPLAPTPSIYQTVTLVRAVFRKLVRQTGLGARWGLGTAALAVEDELRSFLPHSHAEQEQQHASVSSVQQAQVHTQPLTHSLEASGGGGGMGSTTTTTAIHTTTGRPRATSVGRARASSRAAAMGVGAVAGGQ